MSNLPAELKTDFGLRTDELVILKFVCATVFALDEIAVYGSRARGDFRRDSDLDLVIYGNDVNTDLVSRLAAALDASVFPYFVDIVVYSEIESLPLKNAIDRDAKSLQLAD